METMYYIRNEGYLGNALLWWGKEGRGYVCDIRKAGKYTLSEAEGICKRPEDSAYECDYIDGLLEAQKLIIDCQYVDDSKRNFKRNDTKNPFLNRIDNIKLDGTSSDDQWVASADLDGEPMTVAQLENLTRDQEEHLILKSKGILQ